MRYAIGVDLGGTHIKAALVRDDGHPVKTARTDTPAAAGPQAVLDSIDGERTVREIVDTMQGSSFEVCKIIYQFLNSRIVRRKAA